jgi:enoyl-CoA hydratase/carnithine racemase
MDYQSLQLDMEDGLGILTMNRPPGNAISIDLTEEMNSMVGEIAEDSGIRCLIIKSALPKYFMVGADLKTIPPDIDMSDVDQSLPFEQQVPLLFKKLAPHMAQLLHGAQSMMNGIESLPIPTIAAIGGHALGGGMELSMACDLRIMARGKPTIGQTETRLSLIPAAGGTQRLTRLLGRARALEMILLNQRLDADEAKAIGLVTKAVDPEKLDQEVLQIGRELAGSATVAMHCAKKCIIEGEDVPLEEGLAKERDCISMLFDTEDMLEGILSFILGKQPEYKGK